MLSMPSLPELIIILVVVLLLFGGNKLPKLGGALGESIKNFKKGLKDGNSPEENKPSEISQNSANNGNTPKA